MLSYAGFAYSGSFIVSLLLLETMRDILLVLVEDQVCLSLLLWQELRSRTILLFLKR